MEYLWQSRWNATTKGCPINVLTALLDYTCRKESQLALEYFIRIVMHSVKGNDKKNILAYKMLSSLRLAVNKFCIWFSNKTYQERHFNILDKKVFVAL